MQDPEPWNAIAGAYAASAPLFDQFTDRALERLGPVSGMQLLEVACGPGTLALRAARQGARVVATDFAPAMIDEVRRAAAAAGLEEVDPRVMDAERLELDGESFDAAACLFGFMFFPDRARAFRELHRVLRDDGRVVVATWAPIERRPLMQVAFAALGEALPDAPLPQKGDLQQAEECVAEVVAAGFRDVACERVTVELDFDDARDYARLIEDITGPLVMMRRRLGEAAWTEVRAAFVAAVERRVPRGGPFSLGAEALMTSARR